MSMSRSKHIVLSRIGLALTSLVSLVGCSPLRILDTFIGEDGYAAEYGLGYGTGPRQVLDVYTPTQDSARRPVIVFFYGGGWRDGDRDEYRFVADALTSRGYITVIPDYRLFPGHQFPTFMEDGAEAIAWVLEHLEDIGGDPERVYLMGHSAGAHIAALLTVDERYLTKAGVPGGSLAGTIALAGPYAFYPSQTESVAPIFANLTDEDLARPVTFVDGSEPPFLLLHGEEDRTVYPSNTTELSDALRSAGGQVTEKFYPDIGHFKILLTLAGLLPDYAPVLSDMANFIDGRSLAVQE